MLRLPCSMRDCLLITVLALLLLVYIVTPNAKLTPNAEQRQQISALHNKLRTRTVPIPPPTAAAAKFDAPIAKESIPAEAAQSMAERYQRMKAAQQQAAVAAAAAGARKASAASIVSPHIAGGVGGGGAIAGGNVRLPPHAAAVAAVAAAAAASLGAGPVRLLSRDVPARASTPGNLGGPEQVTNDLDSDWLKHRWQIAKDMSGSPLPLPQYIDLQLVSNEAAGVVFVNRVRLDWETAFARAYKIQVATALRTPFRSGIDRLLGGAAEAAANEWTTIYEELSGSASSSRHQHIVHDINLLRTESQRTSAQQMIAKLIPSAASAPALASGVGIGYPARYIRLWLIENGAPWGSSLWRFEFTAFRHLQYYTSACCEFSSFAVCAPLIVAGLPVLVVVYCGAMGCCCSEPSEQQPLLSSAPPKTAGAEAQRRAPALKHVEQEVKNYEQRVSSVDEQPKPKQSISVNSGVSNKIAKWESGQTSSLAESRAAEAVPADASKLAGVVPAPAATPAVSEVAAGAAAAPEAATAAASAAAATSSTAAASTSSAAVDAALAAGVAGAVTTSVAATESGSGSSAAATN